MGLTISLSSGSSSCPSQGAKPLAVINPGFLLTSLCSLLLFFCLPALTLGPNRTSVTAWAEPATSFTLFFTFRGVVLHRLHGKSGYGYSLCKMLKVLGSALCQGCPSPTWLCRRQLSPWFQVGEKFWLSSGARIFNFFLRGFCAKLWFL